MGIGTSLGIEAVSAGSGRAGEVSSRASIDLHQKSVSAGPLSQSNPTHSGHEEDFPGDSDVEPVGARP